MHPFLLLLPTPALAETPFERRLYTDRVDSSSFLWNDWNRFQENYHPLYAVDGDPATAWVEGAATAGVGEWIRFGVTHLDGATGVRLRLRNGYQKSTALYKANARPKQVTVTLLPSGRSAKATLADQEGWQEPRYQKCYRQGALRKCGGAKCNSHRVRQGQLLPMCTRDRNGQGRMKAL